MACSSRWAGTFSPGWRHQPGLKVSIVPGAKNAGTRAHFSLGWKVCSLLVGRVNTFTKTADFMTVCGALSWKRVFAMGFTSPSWKILFSWECVFHSHGKLFPSRNLCFLVMITCQQICHEEDYNATKNLSHQLSFLERIVRVSDKATKCKSFSRTISDTNLCFFGSANPLQFQKTPFIF